MQDEAITQPQAESSRPSCWPSVPAVWPSRAFHSPHCTHVRLLWGTGLVTSRKCSRDGNGEQWREEAIFSDGVLFYSQLVFLKLSRFFILMVLGIKPRKFSDTVRRKCHDSKSPPPG